MDERRLYRDTLKLINETNRRLQKLEKGIDINRGRYNPKTKRYERPDTQIVIRDGKKVKISESKRISYKLGSWASKKLVERIPESIVRGRITTNIGNYSKVQLTALNKALKNFLKNKTSTIKGIQTEEKRIKEDISARLNDFDTEQLTNEDIESLYTLREDKDISYIYNYLTPSQLESLVKYSVARSYSDSQFLDLVSNYIGSDDPFTDLDLRDALLSAYNKMAPYMKK